LIVVSWIASTGSLSATALVHAALGAADRMDSKAIKAGAGHTAIGSGADSPDTEDEAIDDTARD